MLYYAKMKGREMIDFLKETALMAGALVKAGRERLSADAIHAKGTPTDMVTDIDREVEKFIVTRVRERYPDHGFIGEEYGASAAEREYCWIIDPIDGTTSFIHDFPFDAVSIAIYKNGKPFAGAVFAPAMNEFFLAESGKGAFLNGRAIHVSGCAKLMESLLGTGFVCVRAGIKPDNFDYLPAIAYATQGFRRCGAASLGLCYVAAGRFEAYWELLLNIYDIAAGALIVQEAGGQVTDLRGGGAYPAKGILASNGLIHEPMLDFFREKK